MNNKKRLLCALTPILALSFLVGCNKNKPQEDSSSEPKPIEIGDTVKEWKSDKDLDEVPLGCADKNSQATIVGDFGNEDQSALRYDAYYSSKNGYVGSDVLEEPYFTEDDAKNGDIISLSVFVGENSNVASLQLEVFPISMNNSLKSDLLTINETTVNNWHRLVVSFDTLETLGAIRLNYKVVSSSTYCTFFVDDINIVYGAETVKTDYEYKDESLYQAYEDYFKIGCCMSGQMLQNTELRKIAKNDFNSLTAENEGKPERILDQKGCQALAQAGDEGAVAITIEPFRKLYNFCEANHIKVRHHTFVWYSQVPNWFFKKGYNDNAQNVSQEVMLQRMENLIKNTLTEINNRWPGLIYAIDVVNEAIENHTIRNNNNMWYTVVGKDFVYYAFKYARQYAAEGQKLFYNDWCYDNDAQNLTYGLNTLLTRVFQEGLIDGVGIQGHKGIGENMDIVINDAKNIQKKAKALGIELECQITELDLTISGTSEYAKQKTAYKNLMTKLLNGNKSGEMNITAVVVWGIDDAHSWRRGQHALLFTDNFAKKPAYYGFLEAAQAMKPAEEEAVE